ncbi:energy-coupling factor transporter transmembrane component T family protein [Priestia filamentosa]|uniref:Energy-coupling factor transporter transmembrane protein EcfT n=1 Tax=Priestia filamentosa TaxID=1402861 RepID=A0A1X7GBD2_9BACI|nr:energy-coupling factor transporter transmembrane protein EcfT [Priestia filamentosa]AKO90825.1 cobalt ABC transporter permease [Priestia filamentosa]AVD54177.1 energy-coupling factor transporter transmembrane protein EcfT [Priestia filamentosa]MDT3765945.1 energy-coupling factor transporter transmembrane protein EcfT [Priestia filamentosa]OXS65528.1 cobalt ABC transporter permease [Priestia filamentosa]SMF67213.1 energy-coupling factor transport system permease protein [Priestia filamentosa
MMNNMIIGQYVPGDSFIHRMDPRAKLIIVFLYVAVIFLANNIVSYSIIGLFAILSVLISRVPIYFIIKGLKPILFIIIFTFLLHIFMTREGEVIANIGFLKIYEGGVIQGIYISLRFLFLILLTTLLTLTTTPIEVTDGMETLLHPLKKVRFPVHELALMMSISLRFIPTLMDETDKILKAQTARGVDFSSGPLKDRLKAVVPLLIPLFISAFKRAEELATAMEARGYQGGEGRTKYRQLSWGSIDTMALVIFVIVAAALFIVRV